MEIENAIFQNLGSFEKRWFFIMDGYGKALDFYLAEL